jgi:hypothetical protein
MHSIFTPAKKVLSIQAASEMGWAEQIVDQNVPIQGADLVCHCQLLRRSEAPVREFCDGVPVHDVF